MYENMSHSSNYGCKNIYGMQSNVESIIYETKTFNRDSYGLEGSLYTGSSDYICESTNLFYSVSENKELSGTTYFSGLESKLDYGLDNFMNMSESNKQKNSRNSSNYLFSYDLYGLKSRYFIFNSNNSSSKRNISENKKIKWNVMGSNPEFIEIGKDDSEWDISNELIIEYVKETFISVTGESIPENIKIILLEESDFHIFIKNNVKNLYGKAVQGFAIHATNNNPMHQIVIKKKSLAETLTVIGHEIGHVISERKGNDHDEEAKAISFEYAWVRTIKEFDIANIGHIIRNFPLAQNGLHNIAQMFVENRIKDGENPLDVFDDIVSDNISVAEMAAHVLPSF